MYLKYIAKYMASKKPTDLESADLKLRRDFLMHEVRTIDKRILLLGSADPNAYNTVWSYKQKIIFFIKLHGELIFEEILDLILKEEPDKKDELDTVKNSIAVYLSKLRKDNVIKSKPRKDNKKFSVYYM
jgi:DNA-binding ferritin-like protein (Dps family)